MNQIHIRPYQPGDLHDVHTLIAAATALDSTQQVTRAELRAQPEPMFSTAVAVLVDGALTATNETIAGFAWWNSAELPVMSMAGWVHPSFRELGIGTTLVASALSPAKALGATELTARVYSDVPGALDGYRAAGFIEERRFYNLWRDLDDSLLDPPAAPAGVTIRPYQAETDAYLVYEADSEAFSTAWRAQKQSFETWQARMVNHDDPSLWAVAWINERVAGVCISRRSDYGVSPHDGWVGHLGVRPDFQGKGIGRFLLREAFSRLRRAGFDRAGLHVDSLNVAARSLYESEGMKKQRERLHLVRNLSAIP